MVLLTVRGSIEEIREVLSALTDQQHSQDIANLAEAVQELQELCRRSNIESQYRPASLRT